MAEGLPEAPVQPRVTPELILQTATAFMATRHLIAAVEVGVFEALGDDALDLDALATRIAVPSRTARICAPMPWWRWACWSGTGLSTGTVLWLART